MPTEQNVLTLATSILQFLLVRAHIKHPLTLRQPLDEFMLMYSSLFSQTGQAKHHIQFHAYHHHTCSCFCMACSMLFIKIWCNIGHNALLLRPRDCEINSQWQGIKNVFLLINFLHTFLNIPFKSCYRRRFWKFLTLTNGVYYITNWVKTVLLWYYCTFFFYYYVKYFTT